MSSLSRRSLLQATAATALSLTLPRTLRAQTRPSTQPLLQRVTLSQKANDQLLYFTSTSLLADDRRLIFISDRTGHPNLFLLDQLTGQERQLTDNADHFLKSYVYFDGEPYRGFAKASVSVHPSTGNIYYIQGRQIRQTTPDGQSRVLAEYPPDQMTAFTHVSADGKRLCVPTTDARALDGDTKLPGRPKYNIDQRVRTEKLRSYLRVYDTDSGKQLLAEPVVGGWITHVQFSPANTDYILYNHEWCSDSGIRRIWLWDGKQHRPMRPEGNGRSRADWACHEIWERDASAIVYHGAYHKGPSFVGRMNPDGSNLTEIPLDPAFTRYGHFTGGKIGQLVSDGYYQQPDDGPKSWGGRWICQLRVDWENRQTTWQPLCRHGSTWKSQDEHPHPILNHAADTVYFTSDRDGHRAVYRIGVPA